jgi:hypothetical protein
MKTLLLVIAATVALLPSAPPSATAAEKKPAALVSAPLSINPNVGQPICLVTNTSAATTIAVTIEIIDAIGTVVSASLSLPPGGADAATDAFPNFYTYCRITPQDPTQLPLLRGSHCVATGNTVTTCIDARY